MNLKELVEEVKFNIGRRDDLTDHIPRWINLGLEKIWEDYVFSEWEATSYAELMKGVRKLELPPLSTLYTVKLTNGTKEMLYRISSEDYDRSFPEAHTDPKKAEPEVYVQWGRSIELYPVPDKDYQLFIRYIRKPPRLVNDADEPILPYTRLIIAASSMIAFDRLQMDEEYITQRQKYEDELNSARRRESRATDDYLPIMNGYERTPKRQFAPKKGRVWH